MDYSKLSVREFSESVRGSGVNLEDFYAKVFERAKSLNKKYNYFYTISERQAKESLKSLNRGKVAGVPISAKDCICTKGIETTAGSLILKGYVPTFDATCISNLKRQGGVVIGKTAMDEFGFGTFSVNTNFEPPKHPLDTDRSAGGSSGGAGGFTALADFPQIALGESTGGSISIPAAFCGVVGVTPTYGLVSRYGLIDYANSLDKIGVLAKTVEDAAVGLSVISGQDPRDQTTISVQRGDYPKGLTEKVKGLKIGVPKEYFADEIDTAIKERVWEAIKLLESNGATYKEVSLPTSFKALSVYYILVTAEASTNLAKFCGMRYGAEEEIGGGFNEYFSRVRGRNLVAEAKRRILLGTFARMAGYKNQYYLQAVKARTVIINEFRRAFKGCDVLATPTSPVVAQRFDEIDRMTHLQKYIIDLLTVAPNIAGVPHISVPFGSVKKDGINLPVGVQLIGDHLQEQRILNTGHALEGLK